MKNKLIWLGMGLIFTGLVVLAWEFSGKVQENIGAQVSKSFQSEIGEWIYGVGKLEFCFSQQGVKMTCPSTYVLSGWMRVR